MGINSLASILEKMKKGSITEKWGAVCAFDRERLNRILQQQWLEKYDGLTYVPSFSGTMDLNDAQTEYGELTSVLLGKPLLSFEPAGGPGTLTEPAVAMNNKARLTLSILGGTFTAHEKTTGAMYSYNITEAQGYTLTLTLDLSLVVGEVDRFGRVTLDISRGTQFSCDLAAPAKSKEKLGAFFKAQFQALTPDRQVYELGMLNLSGVSDLHPERFVILTQRAPGAAVAGALNASDGAVVVMVKLKADATGGNYPSPETFPYLIPDDEENGTKKYSATMVLASKYNARCDHEKLELIQSLLFPGEKDVFVEHSRYVPHDMVIFGSLDPSKTSLTIEPAVHSLKAGGPEYPYVAYVNGQPVRALWKTETLNTSFSGGEIDPYTGRFQPTAADEMDKEVARNIVTASFTDPLTKQEYRATALLLVTTEAMTLSPGYVSRPAGGVPVTFVATALRGSALTWSAPQYGTLEASGNTAIYTPPTELDPIIPFVIDKIAVANEHGETVEAEVVLSAFNPTLRIDPPFISTLPRSGLVELSETSGSPPELERRWSVLTGGGEVSPDGVFTAPAALASSFSVVQCSIYHGDFLLRTGYSVIKNRSHAKTAGWNGLSSFHITSLTGVKKLYGNGYQQLALDIKLKTDGDPLTLDELSSLRIYYDGSNQEVFNLPVGQTGLPEGDVVWAQTRIPNLYTQGGNPPGLAALTENTPAAEDQHVTVYMMARDTTLSSKFYAVLFSGGTPFSSKDSAHELGTILLTPEESPGVAAGNYTLKRYRKSGGGEDDTGNPNDNDEANFDFYLETLDYWTLSYTQSGGRIIKFRTVEPINSGSQVRWESTFYNERMFSCTGWAFKRREKTSPPPVMTYSPTLICAPALRGALDFEVDHDLPGGDLLFSVVRREDIRQDNFAHFNALKEEGMRFIMTDQEGHRHAIEVGFKAGERNRLDVKTISGTPS